MSQEQLSDLYGVTSRTLRRYKSEGVDIYDPEAVRAWQKNLPECNANDYQVDGEDADTLKLRKLTAETLKKEREAELLKLELEEQEGKLIPVDEVSELNLQIASKVKAQLKAMILSLPPKLEGLSVKQMSKIIQEEIYQSLEYLYGELNVEEDDQ